MQPHAALFVLSVMLQTPAASQYSAEELEELREAPTRDVCLAYSLIAKYLPDEADDHPIRRELLRRNAFKPEDWQRIDGQRLAIGMDSNALVCMWGMPDDINKSVGSWGTHEQWVYGDTYVYVENGRVTSWQE